MLKSEPMDWPGGSNLLPAVVQNCRNGEVLMLGYMNEESYRRTLASGRVTFFSRSRAKIWEKGETSGNFLALREIAFDCDSDAVLVLAEPHGPTCHLNTPTCWGDSAPAAEISSLAFLMQLESVIDERRNGTETNSYIKRLSDRGVAAMGQKVGEEAVEVVIAALAQSSSQLIAESADLLFHLLVLLRSRGLALSQVVAELAQRHSTRIPAVATAKLWSAEE